MTRIVLKTMLNEDLTLKKRSTVIENAIFGTLTHSFIDYPIRGCVQVITLEDLWWTPVGSYNIGDARGYFFEYYVVDGERIEVELEDHVIDDTGIEFRVSSINRHKIHKELILEGRLVKV